MRKIIIFTISLFLMSYLGLSQPTGIRQIMIEEFTQASCGPCGSQNPAFNELIGNNVGVVNSLKYQTSWPGYDPMYEQNPNEIDARTSYYGVTGVPHAYLDGSIFDGSPSDFNQTLIDDRAGIAAPIEITVDWEWTNDNLDSIDITVSVTNTNSGVNFTGDNKLHIAIVEEEIEFLVPPGTNGEFLFEMVMRKMIPDETGSVLGTVSDGSPVSFSFSVELPDYIYRKDKVAVVAFVQNSNSKSIFNSGYFGPVDFPAGANIFDLAANSNSILPENYCDYSFTAGVEITNAGTTPITSYDVYYNINSESTSEVINVSTTLSPGETTTILFSETVVSNGENIVNYWVNNINEGIGSDINFMNNSIDETVFYNLSESSVATEMDEGFEDVELTYGPYSREFPNGLFISPGISITQFGIVDGSFMGFPPIGGYANSVRSIFFHFMWVTEIVDFEFLIDKMDFTGNTHPQIVFDRAYAMTDEDTDDELTVYASVDCGINWEAVYHKQGEELVTAPAFLGLYAPSTAAEWTTDTIHLIDYANIDGVILKFSGKSAYEGALYIDNIRINSIETSVENINNRLNFEIYPNPATDFINMDFRSTTNSPLIINIYNLEGRKMKTVSLQAPNNQIDVSDLPSGMYYLNFISEESSVIPKLVYIK